MDIFEEFLIKNKQNTSCRALTCKSYKEVYKKLHHCELDSTKTNFELATYGDALLKFCLCDILWNDTETQLSEKKKEFETDKFLIENVAKHYNLLDYMNFNREDSKIHQEYKFFDSDCTKYLATTVEAVLGEIYQNNRDFTQICTLIKSWLKLK